MHKREASRVIKMRVGILLCDSSVGGPARVTDTGVPINRRIVQRCRQTRDTADSFSCFNIFSIPDGHAC